MQDPRLESTQQTNEEEHQHSVTQVRSLETDVTSSAGDGQRDSGVLSDDLRGILRDEEKMTREMRESMREIGNRMEEEALQPRSIMEEVQQQIERELARKEQMINEQPCQSATPHENKEESHTQQMPNSKEVRADDNEDVEEEDIQNGPQSSRASVARDDVVRPTLKPSYNARILAHSSTECEISVRKSIQKRTRFKVSHRDDKVSGESRTQAIAGLTCVRLGGPQAAGNPRTIVPRRQPQPLQQPRNVLMPHGVSALFHKSSEDVPARRVRPLSAPTHRSDKSDRRKSKSADARPSVAASTRNLFPPTTKTKTEIQRDKKTIEDIKTLLKEFDERMTIAGLDHPRKESPPPPPTHPVPIRIRSATPIRVPKPKVLDLKALEAEDTFGEDTSVSGGRTAYNYSPTVLTHVGTPTFKFYGTSPTLSRDLEGDYQIFSRPSSPGFTQFENRKFWSFSSTSHASYQDCHSYASTPEAAGTKKATGTLPPGETQVNESKGYHVNSRLIHPKNTTKLAVSGPSDVHPSLHFVHSLSPSPISSEESPPELEKDSLEGDSKIFIRLLRSEPPRPGDKRELSSADASVSCPPTSRPHRHENPYSSAKIPDFSRFSSTVHAGLRKPRPKTASCLPRSREVGDELGIDYLDHGGHRWRRKPASTPASYTTTGRSSPYKYGGKVKLSTVGSNSQLGDHSASSRTSLLFSRPLTTAPAGSRPANELARDAGNAKKKVLFQKRKLKSLDLQLFAKSSFVENQSTQSSGV